MRAISPNRQTGVATHVFSGPEYLAKREVHRSPRRDPEVPSCLDKIWSKFPWAVPNGNLRLGNEAGVAACTATSGERKSGARLREVPRALRARIDHIASVAQTAARLLCFRGRRPHEAVSLLGEADETQQQRSQAT